MKTRPMLATLALLILAGTPLYAANTDLLNLLPTNAEAVLVTEPLDLLGKHFDAFGRAARLPVMPPDQTFSFEQHIARMTGAQVSIDGSRGMAMAVTSIMAASQTFVVFVPVADAQAFVKAADARQLAQTNNLYRMPDGQTYLLPLKKYVALAPDSNALITYQKASHGLKLNAPNADLLNKNQAAAVVKLHAVAPLASAMIIMQAQQQLQNPQAGNSAAVANLMQLAAQRINDLDTLALGLRFDDSGAYLQKMVQAKKGSTLASYLAASPPTTIEPLNNLPAGALIAATVTSLDKKTLVEPLLPLLDAFASTDAQTVDALKKDLPPFAQALLAGPIAGGTYLTSNTDQQANVRLGHLAQPDKVLSLTAKMMPLLSKLVHQAGSPVPLTYKPNAGKIGDTTYHALTMNLPQSPMAHLAGNDNAAQPVTRYIAAIGQNKLVGADSQKAFNQAIQLAQKNTPTTLGQDPAILQAGKKVPPQANFFLFLNTATIGQALANGMQSPHRQADPFTQSIVNAFARLRGICAASASLNQGRLEAHAFIPAQLVRTGIAAFMQLQMTLMQQQMQPQPEAQP